LQTMHLTVLRSCNSEMVYRILVKEQYTYTNTIYITGKQRRA